MDTRGRPARSARHAVGLAALATGGLLLAGCSSSSPEAADRSTGRAAASTDGQTSSAEPSGPTQAPEPSASAIDVQLPLTWLTDEAKRDGRGYALTLTETGRPGVYDGHFFHQARDGAVSGQQFLTITVTGRESVSVTWPDGSVEPGTLALVGDGSPQTEITLDPGCLGFLKSGRSQLDCRLYPAEDPLPSTAASPTQSSASMPGTDEAMGYLCSVDVEELARVTSKDSDPYSTGVLQVALASLGYDPGEVDGSYGKRTRAAVLAYQADASLEVDGLVGPETWTSLQADACRIPDDPAG